MLLIPQPAIFDKKNGFFSLNGAYKINCDARENFQRFCAILKMFPSAEYTDEDFNILVEQSDDLEMEYSINVTPLLIEINYTNEETLFYALTTLKQMTTDSERLQCCNILDKHRYDYRGLLVDADRDFITVEYLKKIADIMACYKLNSLHIRFNECVFNGGSESIENDIQHNFTSENLKNLVAFCNERYVEIIPEVDFSECVEKLSDSDKIAEETQCKESEIIDYCAHIIGGMADIFDSKLLHIGFESISERLWRRSGACKETMAENGIKKVAKLIEYFWAETAKIAALYGKKIAMFGNDVKAKPPKGAVLQWLYNDFKKTICGKWMKRGGNCIISCASYFNLNSGYMKLPLSKVYSFDMMFVGVPLNYRKNVLGYECCFTNRKAESISETERLLFPRIIAFAEKGWTIHSLPFKKFKERLITHNGFLSGQNVDFTTLNDANPNIFRRAAAYFFIMQNRIIKDKKFFKK